MTSTACTLYEGHYHYGVAALTNSLFRKGFRGTVWVGYRGSLPPWAQNATERDGTQHLEVVSGLTLRFLKVETKRHLTNYKADFMIDLRRNYCPDAEGIFYFDPDIVLKFDWPFFEEWADSGVALCEDVNSPMHSTHPLRMKWRRFYTPHGFEVTRDMDVYVNAGFVGVSREHWGFVEVWKRLLDLMAPETNGLSELGVSDRGYLFHKPDQDGLNIAAMFSHSPVSIVGREGMDFIPGGYLMSHALGAPKPWRKAFVREALRGYPPSQADHSFSQHTTSPINLFSPAVRRWKKLDLLVACGLGRFYARP